MKPWFGVFIFLVMLLVMPWSRFETTITTVVNTVIFVISIGCFLSIPAVFLAITIHGLRHPST